MATDFTQDSVLYFLRCNGGRVKNSELLAHFSAFIKDHENQTHNRELFKTFINSVAVVKTEEGVRYVVLRKTFLGRVAGGDIAAGSHSPKPSTGQQPARERDLSSSPYVTDHALPPVSSNRAAPFRPSYHAEISKGPKRDGVPDPVSIPDIHSQYLEESRAAVPQPPQCCLPLDDQYHTPAAASGWSSGYSDVSHSFSHPTSRTASYRDLKGEMRSGASSNKSLISGHDSSYFHRHNLVPLEPEEHDWLVKGAAGIWANIYTLFRDEPSLLTKRDFITGYTILHWIAKHGDHRVLNTLWYGVNKAGLKLDVDVKTTCGYTPLHLAAIHGNDKMIRLLVHKFRANLALRDTSGKKAWQYLSRTGPMDLLEMLGAPQFESQFSLFMHSCFQMQHVLKY
uniref:SOWAHA-C winged helix-turn-helix domain-containing protein n=1 Tax=Salmo trutta TaxID=8032 RepID=A0A674BCC7_SALTR